MRRRHGHHVGPLPIVLGVLVGLIMLGGLITWVLVRLLPVLLLAVLLLGAFTVVRRSARRRRAQASGPDAAAPRRSAAESWTAAKADFDRLRAEYAAHECDPMQVLRRPALSDVSVPSTARFVDAFAEAQAMDTDTHPGEPYDAAYTVAVAKAQRAWRAAQDAADRIRLSNVPEHERGSIERVLKMLTTARDSSSEHERLTAYARARSELDRLDRAGIVHLPRPAQAALSEASRPTLPT